MWCTASYVLQLPLAKAELLLPAFDTAKTMLLLGCWYCNIHAAAAAASATAVWWLAQEKLAIPAVPSVVLW